MPDETELLAQIGRGDQAAFQTLLDRHARYLFGVAHAMTGSNADAEDLLQETLIGALGSAGKFRGESSVRTWLVRILINRVKMWRRARKSRGLDETTSVTGSLASASAPAANSVDAKIDLTQMLEQLTAEHRQVIILRELEGMTYEEMAAALEVPRGTVESRLYRAREELRKRFKGYS